MSWDGIAQTFQATVLSGSLLAAVPVALLAGAISFASPCVLPLIPGYVGYLGGMTGTLARQPGALAAAGTTTTAARRATGQGRLLLGVLLFVLGFSAVFVLLGVVFGGLGLALRPWLDVVTRVMGVVVVLMGLAFMGAVPFLQRDRRLHLSPRAGLWGAPLLGVVFGLGWAPCIGPTLVAITALSLDEGSAVRGGVLSVAYCLGLGVPFLLLALGFQRSAGALRFLREHRLAIMRIGGAVLVVIGLLLVSGLWASWTQSLQGWIGGFETVV